MTVNPSRPVILVTGADLAPEAQILLAPFELVYAGRTPTEDDLVRLCKQNQPVALIVRYGRITERVIGTCSRLRVISKHGSGIDTIDVAAARARGVLVKAAVGANAAAVAEHAWSLILACAKSVTELNARMHEGHWDKATHKSVELDGATLGLVGLGAIGARVARTGLAMGMRVLAYDPFVQTPPSGVTLCDLQQVLRESDVLSLHCPLTAENRGFMNRDAFALMRNGAILVNTARGGLIDEDALVEALRSGKLRAAGLDTFAAEPPPPDHRLKGVPRLVLTPHIGGVTSAAYTKMGVAAARNIVETLGSSSATSTT
ncbi:MAG TPA: hydroxyacid dehydrogenase [Burkholderiales bacterium]|nr:hydroxyacid dehydrogenase [Burkholderiales bacterium]